MTRAPQRTHGAQRCLTRLLRRRHELFGLREVRQDLRVDLRLRRPGELRRLSRAVERLERHGDVAPELHEVVVVQCAEEVRLAEDLVLLRVGEASDVRHLLQDQVDARYRVVDRDPGS